MSDDRISELLHADESEEHEFLTKVDKAQLSKTVCAFLGKIGLACASNLLADGFTVSALSRPSTADFVDLGGRLSANTADLSGACDVIITCLASEAQMDTAYNGPEGLIAHARAGQTVVEMGTFPAAFKKPLADALAARDLQRMGPPRSAKRLARLP